ncbi:MAG: NADH-quinone oxidoreductase subunit N, partial [Nocardioidaceae bacterium]
ITLVVSMETVTLPVFALIGLRRRDRLGAEAAVKFFVASVVATAFTLLGISMVYGATGSVLAGPVATAAATGAAITPVVGVGMVLTVVGLCFKVAVVPFQMWVPDTYVGAPVGVAAYLSVVSKVAGLAGLAVVLGRFFPSYDGTWSPLLAVAAAVTMTLGNLAALRQRNLVRLLAWSSVAQAGYLLVPLAAEGADGLPAMQAYALMYAVVNLGAFAVVTAMALSATAPPQADVAPSARSSSLGGLSSGSSSRGVLVEDAAGLVRRSPLLGAALAFALLCLAGLPPGVVGLLAKVVIFQSAVDGRLTWLAIVMAINVAIGLVYYLRVLVVVLRPGPTAEGGEPRAFVPWPVLVGAGGCLAAAVALSVVPAPLFSALP